LLLPFPAKQALLPQATEKKASFEVALGGEVPPGFHQLRLVSEKGVSLPVVIGVDAMPQLPLAARVDRLPAALHGNLAGAAVLETRFPGKTGQKVIVETEALRLGSKLRPVVHLYNSRRLQLAWSWPMVPLAGDTRLEATLPEDGEYLVAVHDAEYASGGGLFRLKIGQWSYVDHVYPPVISAGQPAKLELVGAGSTVVDAPRASPGIVPLSWPASGTWSGTRPLVRLSPHPQLAALSAGQPQELPPPPVGVSGRLTTPYAEDRYRLAVTPFTRLRFEVQAERYGSPLDAALVLRSDKGDVLARAEDGPGTTDPVLDYVVPANLSALVVGVIDSRGQAGPRHFYHLAIGSPSAEAMVLTTPAERLNIAHNGRDVLPVWLDRADYEGPVELFAAGLPDWVQLEGNVVPEGADGALVTLSHNGQPGPAAITRWTGKGDREAELHIKGHGMARLQPWLAREIAVAPTSFPAADFSVDWNNLPADAVLVPGSRLPLPVRVNRAAKDAPVRLSVVTGQNPPLGANNQPDPNRALRAEKPVDLAANVSEGEVTLLVPGLLPATVYDVTVRAELLSADKKTVLASAVAPVRRLSVQHPLVVHLDSRRVEVPLDRKSGTTVKLQGKLERKTPLGDVTINLADLPAGVKAEAAVVKANTSDFALGVFFPAGLPAGEVHGVKLTATAAADPKQPNVRVSSRETRLTFILK
jgi:hypothetical protein